MKLSTTSILSLFLAAGLSLVGCGESEDIQGRLVSGDIEAGNVFRLNEVNDVRSLYPLDITEAIGFRLANQVYEGLVKFNQKTLELEPALAEKWQSNRDATEWTFFIREGVKFHDDECFPDGKGREVTARDVEWCVKQLCKASPNNQMFWLVADRVKGAQEYYDLSVRSATADMHFEGIELLNDYTIRFHLTHPFSNFPQIMGHNGMFIYPKEALEHYGDEMNTHAVGTGPFTLKVFKPNEMAVLERNPDYWDIDMHGNQLPYLDAIQISFVKEKKTELHRFRNGELDMVFTLPVEMYSEVMEGLDDDNKEDNMQFDVQVTPSMSVHYYAFLHTHEVFKDRRIRKAFNLAIDRQAIVNQILKGEGEPGIYGIIPPAFQDFDHKKLTPITYDPEKARFLLESAGFPDGEGFPELTMEFATGGSNNELVAQVVASMLKENLGINLNIKGLPMVEVLDHSESGQTAIWKDGWVADYPDPENFLRLFVSEPEASNSNLAYMNSVRYSSALYDSIYYAAIEETNPDTRNEHYRTLDQLLIDEAVVMPLYYEEYTRLIPTYVNNMPQNSIEYRDFTQVWINSKLRPKK